MIAIGPEGQQRLLEALAFLEAEPLRFRMDVGLVSDALAPCGTAGCIAGTLVGLHRAKGEGPLEPLDEWEDTSRTAFTLLMPQNSPWAASNFPLFHVREWPLSYRIRYNDSAMGLRHESEVARRESTKLLAELIREVVAKGGIWWTE